MSHTEGPWGVQFDEGVPVVCDSTGHPVSLPVMVGQAEDNARLISAAPDLLALLREGVALHREAHVIGSSMCDYEERARAAIAKARGEA